MAKSIAKNCNESDSWANFVDNSIDYIETTDELLFRKIAVIIHQSHVKRKICLYLLLIEILKHCLMKVNLLFVMAVVMYAIQYLWHIIMSL